MLKPSEDKLLTEYILSLCFAKWGVPEWCSACYLKGLLSEGYICVAAHSSFCFLQEHDTTQQSSLCEADPFKCHALYALGKGSHNLAKEGVSHVSASNINLLWQECCMYTELHSYKELNLS